jgi:hypothetical protein
VNTTPVAAERLRQLIGRKTRSLNLKSAASHDRKYGLDGYCQLRWSGGCPSA